jgi:hypothetical protein
MITALAGEDLEMPAARYLVTFDALARPTTASIH